jgi:hypothetical protein
LTALGAAVLALGAADARAIVLGEPEVSSALGEALDVRIPVTLGSGESIEPACFMIVPEPAADIPRLHGARVSVQRSAAGTYVRIQSAAAINEPALVLSLVAACPGQLGEYKREYSVLLDPRRGGRAVAEAPPSPGVPSPASSSPIATVRAIAATLVARIGDTLESIANAIFPRNRAAKKSYIEALRETNPPLAALGENEQIPLDAPIALPDLRTFAQSRPRRETDVATAPPPAPKIAQAPAEPKAAAAPRPKPAPRERTAPPPVRPAPERKAPTESAVTARARTAPNPLTAPGPGFVLKLSSSQVDMSRSRTTNDRTRAELRDRQLVLDNDDQVAALLSLRNSVRQLESKVAELQLKLSGMPSTFPAPRTAEKPATPAPTPPKIVEAPAPTPPPVTKVEPPVVTKVEPPAPKVEPAPAPAPKAEPAPAPVVASTPPPTPAPETSAPATPSAPEAKTEAASPVPTPSAPVVKSMPRPVPAPPPTPIDWMRYGLWGMVVLFFALAALLAIKLAKRKREHFGDDDFEPPDEQIVVADEHLPDEPDFAAEPFDEPEDRRRELDSDVELSTRLPGGNTDDLRRRYIEERFPEIAKGAIVLDDADSVVKGARLFYEDGAIARAIELLQYAIEREPGHMKTWLALFEIFRLERSATEFADLARRFKEQYSKSEFWRKVQYFGREIDPGNTLYQEDPINTFETIGPSQAKRLAGGDFDPIAENWLGAPMDFENEVLANELRKTLMAEAGINEQDLIPNPMPALRNVEMFTVA